MFAHCIAGRKMVGKITSLAILKGVAGKNGTEVDTVNVKKAVATEVKEYRDRCARREERAKRPKRLSQRRKTLTLKRTISYSHLLQALVELKEQAHGLWPDIEEYIFIATGEDGEVHRKKVESSLAFIQKLIESAKNVSKGPGRPSGSIERLFFDGLLDVFEQSTQTEAEFSRRTEAVDKRPYGAVIDFIKAVISEHGLEKQAMKPSAKMRAQNPDALSDISENIAKLIQHRRSLAPGKLTRLAAKQGLLDLIIAPQSDNTSN